MSAAAAQQSAAVDEVKGWLSRGERVVFLDSESPDVWIHAADKSVTRLPQEKVGSMLAQLPRDAAIVTFTSSGSMDSAALYAGTLRQQGFTRARPLSGGRASWSSLALVPATPARVYPSLW